jgi:hypothetical protein
VDARFMVFGFQASGKTTFAAALWHLLDSREVPTALQKGKHTGDFSYLEEIAQAWSEGWELDRTKTKQIEAIKINLLHAATKSEVALEFTDLSGETFESAFATRLCSPEFVEMAKRAEGLLLFVSASRVIDSVAILDVLDPEEDTAEPEQVEDAKWDPSKTPLQVQLVDLLQSLRHPPFNKSPLKVAVIVSAWDLAKETATDADRWLAGRYPLLHQFLNNNEGIVDVRVYGVSAQGGQLSKKDTEPGKDRERLLSVTPPSKRIEIVGPGAAEHDLSRPLFWLAGLGPPVG